jgi:hypothetical protein
VGKTLISACFAEIGTGPHHRAKSAGSTRNKDKSIMNDEYCIGRISFGPRDSFTTLGQLIDEIAAQEELVEDLCVLAGNQLTEILWAQEHMPVEIYEL